MSRDCELSTDFNQMCAQAQALLWLEASYLQTWETIWIPPTGFNQSGKIYKKNIFPRWDLRFCHHQEKVNWGLDARAYLRDNRKRKPLLPRAKVDILHA